MESIEEKFAKIRTYSEGGQPALHKPLLILFMLGRCFLKHERMITFSVVDDALKKLFGDFYPIASERANTHYPFGRLEFDGVWELEQGSILKRTSVGHLFKGELLEKNIHAGFSLDIYSVLYADKNRLSGIADQILNRYFPKEQHAALRAAVGLPQEVWEVRDISPKYLYAPEVETKSNHDFPVKEPALSAKQNGLIAYLNSLHNLGAGGANALAEAQALNRYFSALYEPFPLVETVVSALQNGKSRVVVLTGHAGDGKSTVALDVFKRLHGLPLTEPLTHALRERETIHLTQREVVIVKDMSELSAQTRLQWLEEAFNQPGSWLLISNTGPLLNSLCDPDFLKRVDESWQMIPGDVENRILDMLSADYTEGELATHTFAEFRKKGKDLVILNLTRLDNVELGTSVLRKMLNHPAWAECAGCSAENACPLRLNRKALQSLGAVLEDRVRWVYQRLTHYEQRLTLRQMVAHLALSLTGGIDCKKAQSYIDDSVADGIEKSTDGLAKIIFSETFFGYRNGRLWDAADGLRAIALARRLVAGGPVAVDYERGPDWAELPETLNPLWRRWRQDSASFNGVAWRFAVRRMIYFFGQSAQSATLENTFLNTFLRSSKLREFDRWQREGKLAFSIAEQKKLRNACLRVLLECYSGFSAGQFEAQDRLYLTLRRADRAIAQPTQWIVAAPSFNDFELYFNSDLRLPAIRYQPNPAVELKLCLPLLDYIQARDSGELGGGLARIHWAQLDTFRAELLKAQPPSDNEEEITLLRVGIDGRIHLHSYVLDYENNALEIV